MEFLAFLYTVLLVAICLMMALLLYRSAKPAANRDDAERKEWLRQQLEAQNRQMDAKLAEMAQQNLAGLQFVRDGLALQKRYSLRVPVPQQLFQLPDVAVFTAQSQHQYTACIGMADQITQDTTGMLLIVAHLGTSVRMRECTNSFNIFSYKSFG